MSVLEENIKIIQRSIISIILCFLDSYKSNVFKTLTWFIELKMYDFLLFCYLVCSSTFPILFTHYLCCSLERWNWRSPLPSNCKANLAPFIPDFGQRGILSKLSATSLFPRYVCLKLCCGQSDFKWIHFTLQFYLYVHMLCFVHV